MAGRKMHKTIADVIEKKGFKKGAMQNQREVLVKQLQIRFKHVKKATMDRIVAEIQATNDNNLLTAWIKEFASANAITDMSFRCLTQ